MGITIKIGGLSIGSSSQSGSSYWTTRYITALSVVTTADDKQTITATIVGTGFDGVSYEYSTDAINYTEKGTAAGGTYNATGLTAGTLYYWRARLYKGASFGANSSVASDTTFAPLFADMLFLLDGEIIEDGGSFYFKDQSANERHFLITNYDWAGEYYSANYGIFPFKTKATISAPADDAALIAADTGNFFYDSGGTPIALRPQFFFQNVNYENQIFSREVAHTIFPLDFSEVSLQGVELSPSGILDITMYSSARTGADITTCNTYYGVPTKLTTNVYWVAKSGNDDTGNGSESTPYLTIQKAETIVNEVTGKTIYVKSGSYEEGTFLDISWWAANNAGALTIKGLGGVSVSSTTNAAYGKVIKVSAIRSTSPFTLNLTGLNVISKNVTNQENIGYDGTGSGVLTLNLSKMSFYTQGGGAYGSQVYVNNTTNEVLTIDKCCMRGANAEFITTSGYFYVTNSFVRKQVIIAFVTGSSFYYNKFDSEANGNYGGVLFTATNVLADDSVFNCCWNTFFYGHLPFQALATLHTLKINLLRNVFKKKYTGYAGQGYGINIEMGAINAAYTDFDVKYNYFEDLIDDVGSSCGFSLFNGSYLRLFDVSYNNFKSTSTLSRSAIGFNPTAENAAGCKINYNHIEMESYEGVGMCTSDSLAGNDRFFVGVEVIGNYVRGYRLNHGDPAGASFHGFLVRGKDCIVKDNFVSYCNLGYVLKSNDCTQSTAVFENNIAYNNAVAFTSRALNNLTVNNNVFAVEDSDGSLINLYGQNQSTLDVVFSNNLFYIGNTDAGAPLLIAVVTATMAAMVFENNVIQWQEGNDKIFYNTQTSQYKTLADAITEGISVDNQVAVSIPFNSITTGKLWLNSKLSYGKDLGAARKTRLAVSSDWQAVDSKGFYLPDINTIDDDDVVKQCGAYGL